MQRVLQRMILNELSKDVHADRVLKDAEVKAVLEYGAVKSKNVEVLTV